MISRCIKEALAQSHVIDGKHLTFLQMDFAYDVMESLMQTEPQEQPFEKRAHASARLVIALQNPTLFPEVTHYLTRMERILEAIKERGLRFLDVYFEEERGS